MDLILAGLLIIEVLVIMAGVTSYMVWMLRKVALSRAALFTVFLFVPSGLLRSLAKKKTEIGDGSDDDEDYGNGVGSLADNKSGYFDDGASTVMGDDQSVQNAPRGGGAPRRASADGPPKSRRTSMDQPHGRRTSMDVPSVAGDARGSVDYRRSSMDAPRQPLHMRSMLEKVDPGQSEVRVHSNLYQ